MKKRILIIVNHEIVIYNFRKELVETLVQEGNEVGIISPLGEKMEYFTELGAQHFEVSVNRHGVNIFKEYLLYKTYYRTIKAFSPDYVLTYTIKPNIYGGLAAKKCNVPYLSNVTGLGLSLQDDTLYSKLLKSIYIYSLKSAQKVFFQNQEDLNTLNNSRNKINSELLPGSGVNTEEFTYKEYPENELIKFTYLGRLMKNKGTIELIDAFKKMKNLNVELNLVGFIDDDIQKEIDDAKIMSKGRIKHFDFTDSPIKFIEMSDVIINPSYHEGMSNVLLEGAAVGRPLIASNIAGCKEIINVGINGYLFEPKSVNSIIEAVKKIINIPLKGRVKMGKESRLHVINNFDRNIIIKRYIDELKSESS